MGKVQVNKQYNKTRSFQVAQQTTGIVVTFFYLQERSWRSNGMKVRARKAELDDIDGTNWPKL